MKAQVRLVVRGPNAKAAEGQAVPAQVPVEAVVVQTKTGQVNFFDRAKFYYKWLIAAIGSILVIVNEVTPLLNFVLPDGSSAQRGFSVVVVVLTQIGVALKENEKWIDKLPSAS